MQTKSPLTALRTLLQTMAPGFLISLVLGGVAVAQPPIIQLPESQPANRNPGYLGLTADDNPDGRGVKVLEIAADSPAQRAGLKAGDVILALDDQILRDVEAMIKSMQARKAGGKIKIDALRQGRLTRFEDPLAAVPNREGGNTPAPQVPNPRNRDYARELLGVELQDVPSTNRSPALVVVKGVVAQPDAKPSLPLGASIREIARTRGRSVADCQRVLAQYQPGDRVDVTFVVDNLIRRSPIVLGAPDPNIVGKPPAGREAEGGGLFESRLGEAGRRPILGRLGRALDGALGGKADQPVPRANNGELVPPRLDLTDREQMPIERPRRENQVDDELAQEVRELRLLVEALLDRVEELEKKPRR